MKNVVTISCILIPIIFIVSLFIAFGTGLAASIFFAIIPTEIAIYGSLILYYLNKKDGNNK